MRLYAAELNFRRVAEEFRVPTDFSPAVHQAAASARDRFADRRRDARDVPFVTVDPPGSQDLDQAVHLTRRGDGYRVRYAIADVAAFVVPGGVVEAESLRRGQTIYLPDEPARLHPAALSEGSASLLPGVDRPAVVWTMDLDAAGGDRVIGRGRPAAAGVESAPGRDESTAPVATGAAQRRRPL